MSNPFVFWMHRNEKENWFGGFSNQMQAGQTLENPSVGVFLDGVDKVADASFVVSNVQVSTVQIIDRFEEAVDAGQAVIYTLEGTDALVASDDYEIRIEADVVEDGRHLICQRAKGLPLKMRVTAWGEAA